MAPTHGLLTIKKHNRLRLVHKCLMDSSRQCTLDGLAERLNVSGKTISRLMKDLKDLYGAEIKYDSKERHYRYSKPPRNFENSLSGVQTTEPDRLNLALGVKALEFLNLSHPADELRKWLMQVSGESLDFPLKNLHRLVSFTDQDRGIALDTDIRTLLLAICKRCVIEFRYRNRGSSRPQVRKVDPCHMTFRESNWYLIGWAHDRQALRTFALARMAGITPLQETFQDRDFQPDAYFKDAGIVQTGKPIRVHLRFSQSIAEQVQERNFLLNYTEAPALDARGQLHLKFHHYDPEGLLRFILSYGPDVKVMAPRSLRTALEDRLRDTLGLYCPPPSEQGTD